MSATATTVPLCVNCHHVDLSSASGIDDLDRAAKCMAIEGARPVSLVSGQPIKLTTGMCSSVRGSTGRCGPEGRLFQQRSANEPS